MVAVTGAYERETLFDRELAPSLGCAVPLCRFSSVEANGSDFLLLLEDLAPATIVDQRTGGSVDQLAAVLDRAADLHGTFWGRPRVVAAGEARVGALAGQVPGITEPWLGRFGLHLDPELADVVRRLGQAAPSWLTSLRHPRTVWHGDLRLDMVLFDARDGATLAAVVDWHGKRTWRYRRRLGRRHDLEAPTRRARERDLVAEYHRRLTSYDAVNGGEWLWVWRVLAPSSGRSALRPRSDTTGLDRRGVDRAW